ncbi:type I pullulanase [Paenibacillus sp. M1]|uniref:Type I pullulanase n=1 Tax=Paenibacillus haidiansis TaxID=1574488 RepID=A0ABU7VS13_9BACL
MAVQQERKMETDYGDPAVTGGISVFSQEFDEVYRYDGDDLGALYTPERTSFRLWAPTASEARLRLYPAWDSPDYEELPMTRERCGTWAAEVEHDLQNTFYTYYVRVGRSWNEAVDPYAKAVGVNGDRGVIVDLTKTNPERWTVEKPQLAAPTDAVIYELHVGDFSVHPESGIRYKGQYLGLAETGTRGPGNLPTGLDYLKQLGITHVQLLPVQDYAKASVDEIRTATGVGKDQYNWGYDPKNYNVPEGSYASDPFLPALRITELKRAIQAMHDHGLRVILDVVYNHIYDGYIANLSRLVPGYYLRYKPDGTFSNGSGCGNDCASERPMMSKLIADSVVYWAAEYHVDGFRFDLMGLLDVDTMNEIRRRLDAIDPSILLLGEGWIMDTELPAERRANLLQAARMPGIAHFNGELRNALKGEVFTPEQPGFISGRAGLEREIQTGAAGSIHFNANIRGFAREPAQTVNFAECHDNHTLWDKLAYSAPKAGDAERRRMHRLATAIVLTSQGIPFLHAGQEFLRTKGGLDNSFRAQAEVNRLDWGRRAEYRDEVEYVRSLIVLRKEHPAFRLRTAEAIQRHLKFEPAAERAVAYTLRDHAGGDRARHLYVLYHAAADKCIFPLPELGEWQIIFGEDLTDGVNCSSGKLVVNGIGMIVLAVW